MATAIRRPWWEWDRPSELLSRIPGAQVTPLDSGCCGMAGMFGYERKHYDVSRAVGELRLFPALREAASGTAVVAPGFSCRHQIDHFTDRAAVSSMELLASLMGEENLWQGLARHRSGPIAPDRDRRLPCLRPGAATFLSPTGSGGCAPG